MLSMAGGVGDWGPGVGDYGLGAGVICAETILL